MQRLGDGWLFGCHHSHSPREDLLIQKLDYTHVKYSAGSPRLLFSVQL